MSGKAVLQSVRKAIDWDYLAKVIISDSGKRELANLRRAFDDVSNTLDTKFNLKIAELDWGLYKKKLNPKVVDIFQKSYESLDIPEYEDKITPEFQKKHEELVAEAIKEEEFSLKEIERIKFEMEEIKKEKAALETMTVDDYFSKHPDVKEKIDEEIKNNNWGY